MAQDKDRFYSVLPLPKDYFNLTPEKKREAVKKLLMQFSPNPEVRKMVNGGEQPPPATN